MKYVLIGLLKVYRLVISPLYGDVCRYYPSCSAYALRAVSVHGAVKGSWLTLQRLLRCHPWSAGGYDPVPGTPEHAEEVRDQARRAATMGPARPDQTARQPGESPDVDSTPDPRPGRHGDGNHDHDPEMASPRGVN